MLLKRDKMKPNCRDFIKKMNKLFPMCKNVEKM